MYILAKNVISIFPLEKVSDYSKYLNLYFTPLLKPVDALKCEALCYLDEGGDSCSVSSTCVAPLFFFFPTVQWNFDTYPLFLNPATNPIRVT